MTTYARAATSAAPKAYIPFGATDLFQMYLGIEVPDPITFVTGERWCNRPNIYPRQATLLKIIFLRDDLFTDYDNAVIDEWEENYRITGNNGIVPHIRFRIRWLKRQGYKWFREVLLVMGRRAGKGHVTALAMAYVLWNYMAKGDPQGFYGIDRDKRLACLIFAGKRDQAKATVYGDLNNVITGAECFAPFISQVQTERLSIYAPFDFVRMKKMSERGIRTERDMATFEIMPKESTPMAGRGPTSFQQAWDEMAHVVTGSVGRNVDEVYDAAKPSLDQFGKDAFIIEPSSPWQMMGKFYDNYLEAVKVDEYGEPVRPNYLMIQLASWDIYKDWEQAGHLLMFPEEFEGDLGEYREVGVPYFKPLKGAIQVFDDEMRREKAANPETFAVERECLDPKTRVLKADLTWVPIKDIRAGDHVVAIDEEAPGNRRERRLRTATVVATKTNHNVAYRIDFEDGTHVICSGNHRWLSMSAGSGGSARWRSLFAAPGAPGPRQMIRVGDRIRQLVDPWEVDQSYDSGYLAGVYDGEGSVVFCNRSEYRIDFPQNPGVVLDKTLETLERLGFTPTRAQPEAARRCQRYKITGMSECMRFLGQVRPARLLEQGAPLLWEGRALGKDHGRAMAKTITAITELPEQELVDLETSTGTFVAEGLISHNSHFATALDAYLNEKKVRQIFMPWEGRPARYGPPELVMQSTGVLTHTYKGHADPSKVNDKFGFAVAHVEIDELGRHHCVFDLMGAFDPQDFDGNIIDYEFVDDYIWDNIIKKFYPDEFTFDQYNSTSSIQKLQKRIRNGALPKRVNVFEKTATRPYDWMVKENSKAAINLELVHAPYLERAELELRFLQLVNGRVDHPSSGPVQSKDIADSMTECIHVLIGEQTQNFIHSDLNGLRPGTNTLGDPFPGMSQGGLDHQEQDRFNALSGFGRARGGRPDAGGASRRRRY